jgi:hypothetical protein
MIGNHQELQATLHSFGSFLDMLEALRLQAEETQSMALLAHLAKGPIALLEERAADLRACLENPPPFLAVSPKLYSGLRFCICLADALLAVYRWSAERDQFPLFAQSAAGLILNLHAVTAEMRDFFPQQEAA